MQSLKGYIRNMASDQKKQLASHFSVDCVVFGFDLEKLNVLIIDRGAVDSRFEHTLALPGDLIQQDEALDVAADRVLEELTGLQNVFLEQVGAFGDPKRISKESDIAWLRTVRSEPDARVITIAYYSLVNMIDYAPRPSSFAQSAEWMALDSIKELAFDHMEILDEAKKQLRERLRVQPVGFNLLGKKFTLSQLNKLYEAILGRSLDKRNFRRKILKLGILNALDEKEVGVAHKPSQLFEFNEEEYNRLIKQGFDNFSF